MSSIYIVTLGLKHLFSQKSLRFMFIIFINISSSANLVFRLSILNFRSLIYLLAVFIRCKLDFSVECTWSFAQKNRSLYLFSGLTWEQLKVKKNEYDNKLDKMYAMWKNRERIILKRKIRCKEQISKWSVWIFLKVCFLKM